MKGTTDEGELTELQRLSLATQEAARVAGKPLSVYAREQGLEVRRIYDAIVAVRRRGRRAEATAPSRTRRSARAVAARDAFVALEVRAGTPGGGGVVRCRVLVAGDAVIECHAWPDPAWLRAVLAMRVDAAA